MKRLVNTVASGLGMAAMLSLLLPTAVFAQSEDTDVAVALCYIGIVIGVLVTYIAILDWVIKDAKKRGARAGCWFVIVLLFGVWGILVYLVARPKGKLLINGTDEPSSLAPAGAQGQIQESPVPPTPEPSRSRGSGAFKATAVTTRQWVGLQLAEVALGLTFTAVVLASIYLWVTTSDSGASTISEIDLLFFAWSYNSALRFYAYPPIVLLLGLFTSAGLASNHSVEPFGPSSTPRAGGSAESGAPTATSPSRT